MAEPAEDLEDVLGVAIDGSVAKRNAFYEAARQLMSSPCCNCRCSIHSVCDLCVAKKALKESQEATDHMNRLFDKEFPEEVDSETPATVG